MKIADAVSTLAALGQPTRLETFRLLVRGGPEGIAAGDIAASLGIPRNTMSSHLAVLTRAGLIQSQRVNRNIYYRPDLRRLTDLTRFLLDGCCGDQPELCGPQIRELEETMSQIK